MSDHGVIITDLVMTFSKLSATGKYAINTGAERLHDKNRVDPAGAHDSDHSDVRWVLKTGNARGIGSRIAAPITQKAQNSWVVWFFDCHLLSPSIIDSRGSSPIELSVHL